MKHPILASILAGGMAGVVGSAVTSTFLYDPPQAAEPISLVSNDSDLSSRLASLREDNEQLANRIEFLEQRPMVAAPTRVAEVEPGTGDLDELRQLSASLKAPGVSQPMLDTVTEAVKLLREQESREREERQAQAAAERLEERLAELSLKLGMDVNQTNQMRTLLTDESLKRNELMSTARDGDGWGNMRESMRDLRNETQTAVKNVLTPTQYEQYSQESRGGGRGGGFGAGGGGGGNDSGGATTQRRRRDI